ncbi:L,D-transpeptidase family protein [Desulfurispora thermophila]|uniref:L,D-transpeptidase family protein n=1 Tax=Desulfurispora thermophila TaxID=265470 RepID=UPI000365B698|nr:L,D-transpeptidase family protein [Desulfurispora thermophila]
MLQTSPAPGGAYLLINTKRRRLQYFAGGILKATYPVAVGKPATPTPTGHYRIVNKVVNPGGVLGSRWMGLNIPGGNYGIHGTNNPASIGTMASKGCIRMHNRDIESLFPQVPVGTPVIIVAAEQPQPAPAPIAGSPPLDNALPDPAPETTAPTERYHVVRPGDTLWAIARRYGIELDRLLALNQLPTPHLIYPGQKIRLP